MLIPVEELIDGLVRTLTEAVLPDVPTRFARGQLYAAIDVLRNLRDRVEEKAAPLEVEAAAAERALDAAATALRAGGESDAAERIAAARGAGCGLRPAPRAAALRDAVVVALESLDTLPAERSADARDALATYLVTQALADVAGVKPSLLGEISKG